MRRDGRHSPRDALPVPVGESNLGRLRPRGFGSPPVGIRADPPPPSPSRPLMADLPEWKPIDGVAPPSSDGAGLIIGVVASEAAASDGWAPSAVLDLARSWSAAGRRVILIDGALQAPSLHEAAGITNREGLTDAALYGASIGRISRPVPDGDFFLVTTGTPVADPSSVVRSGRWHRLAEGITQAGAILMLYLRDGYTGTPAFLGSASDIVVLSSPGDRAPSSVTDLAPMVRAVTGVQTSRDAATAPSASRGPAASVAPRASAAPAAPRQPAPGARPAAANVGMGRLLLLLIVALLVAAGLGFLLTSVI